MWYAWLLKSFDWLSTGPPTGEGLLQVFAAHPSQVSPPDTVQAWKVQRIQTVTNHVNAADSGVISG